MRMTLPSRTETFIPRDNVNNPSHYNSGKIEVIDFIEDQRLGFALGNVIKYVARAGKKNKELEVEDLKKAAWYLDHHIKQLLVAKAREQRKKERNIR